MTRPCLIALIAVLGFCRPAVADPTMVENVLPGVVAIFTDKADSGLRRLAPDAAPQRQMDRQWSEDEARNLVPKGGTLLERRREHEPLGSGFVFDSAGHIVTNHHVIANAGLILVSFSNGGEAEARIVGADPLSDLAVLAVADAPGARPLPLAEEAPLRPGQTVFAIGAPFGFSGTVTAGIVSALDRRTPDNAVLPLIQHQAPLNVGNSGGPLVDAAGRVVGINSAIFSPDGADVGLGFAIPIGRALPLLRQLAQTGSVVYGGLEVSAQTVTHELAAVIPGGVAGGVLITDLPSEEEALAIGDLVVACHGEPVLGEPDLVRIFYPLRPGDETACDVIRNGRPQSVGVAVRPGMRKPREVPTPAAAVAGVISVPLDSALRGALGLPRALHGLLVLSVGPGSGEMAGLRSGDILLAIGGRPLASARDLSEAVAVAGAGVALLVQRGSQRSWVAFGHAARSTGEQGRGIERAWSKNVEPGPATAARPRAPDAEGLGP